MRLGRGLAVVQRGRRKAEGALLAEVRIPRGRFGRIGGIPRQRHAAAVAALVGEVPAREERRGVFEPVPGNIRHFEQTQLLALIHIDRSGQAGLHENRRPGAARAQLAVFDVACAVAQNPVLGKLMMGGGADLRQAVARGVARHVMVAHDPGRGRAVGLLGGIQPVHNGFAEIRDRPVRLGELEVEHLPQLFGRRVEMLVLGHDPCLADGEARRIVLIEHPAPLAIDVVHLRTVPQRILAIVAQAFVHRVAFAELFQRLALQILGQAMRHVDAEAVGAVVAPEAQRLLELLVHVGVLPVEVGLLLGEDVQIPLPVLDPFPGRSAEQRHPVVRRQLAVCAPAFAEDVAVARCGAAAGLERFLEEHMLVGGMVRHDVDDDLQPGCVRGGGHGVEIIHGAQPRIDVAVIDDVVSAVRQVRRVERGKPERVDAEVFEIVDLRRDAGDIAQAVAVSVFEAARVDLVDDRLLPPVVAFVVQCHRSFLGCLDSAWLWYQYEPLAYVMGAIRTIWRTARPAAAGQAPSGCSATPSASRRRRPIRTSTTCRFPEHIPSAHWPDRPATAGWAR